MADNIGYTPGVGATVATDEVAGLHHQKILPEYIDTDGVTPTVVSANTPFPVATSNLPLPAGAATDGSIILLRRIAKILENQQAVDPQQRQRITVDSISGGVTLPTVTTVGTVTTVTTVTTVSSVTNLAAVNGWNQQMFADPARTSYNTGIRRWLSFS